MASDDFEKLLEDLDDLAVIAGRHDEETVSDAEMKRSAGL